MAPCHSCGLQLNEDHAFCPFCGRARDEMTVGAAWERNAVNAPTISMLAGLRPPGAAPLQPPGMGTPAVPGMPGTPFPQNAVVTGITGVKPVEHTVSLSVEAIVGALAGIGVIVGSLLDWLKPVNAFKVPAWWLLDIHTKHVDPRLGWITVGLGAIGILTSILRLRKLRVTIALVTIAACVAFIVQVLRALNDTPIKRSFTDIVGFGPYVTLGAAVLLLLSPLFGRPRADR
jgi:hypothetical protein